MPDGLFGDPLHWVILLVVVLIVFGPGKLPGVGAALGKSVREFKKATQEDEAPSASTAGAGAVSLAPSQSVASEALPEVICPSCGKQSDGQAQFCGDCGGSLVKDAVPVAEPVPPRTLTCANCNAENPGSNRFCARCGRIIEATLSHA